MMIKKLKGEEFETEFPMPNFDRVDPNPAVKDITKAKIAIVTSGVRSSRKSRSYRIIICI